MFGWHRGTAHRLELDADRRDVRAPGERHLGRADPHGVRRPRAAVRTGAPGVATRRARRADPAGGRAAHLDVDGRGALVGDRPPWAPAPRGVSSLWSVTAREPRSRARAHLVGGGPGGALPVA